jgi:CMP-N,N'-diacetyllegionaminic acid synthase
MTMQQKKLFLIPARGGSKRLPGKNVKKLNGKPLICYSFELARELAPDDDICISTDDREIIRLAEQYGLKVPFIRPSHLATDESATFDVIKHALEFYENKKIHYDGVILLQPTSPFRKVENIKEVINLLEQDINIEMVVSVKETTSNPYFVLFEEDNNGYLKKSKPSNFTRSQDCPKVYEFNGAIYAINVSAMNKYHSFTEFIKIKKYLMDELHSVDIDSHLDWTFCEFLLEKGIIDID